MSDGPRARYEFEDLQFRRVTNGSSMSGVLITDEAVFVAADPAQAFEAHLRFAEWLCLHMEPNSSWRAAHIAVAHGRAATRDDARARAGLSSMTSASDILNLAREVLGADAYTKLRDAAAARMLAGT
jgi:hypothetical protein